MADDRSLTQHHNSGGTTGSPPALVLRKGPGERAVVIIEAIFEVVLVLIAVWSVLLFTFVLASKVTLELGVSRALRAGVTRGNIDRAATVTIPDINTWHATARGSSSSSSPTPPQDLLSFLKSAQGDLAHYDSWANERFKRSFAALPVEWLYTLVYINESVRSSLGSLVQYPCDATVSGPYGCLDCRFTDPLLRAAAEVSSNTILERNPLRVECAIRPPMALTAPLASFVSSLSRRPGFPSFVIRTQQLIDAYEVREFYT